MMALTPDDLSLLTEILGRLDSDHHDEVVAAGATAIRFLRERSLTWGDVLASKGAAPPASCPPSGSFEWQQLADICLAPGSERTDRESVFRAGLLSNRMVLAGIAAEIAVLLVLIMVPPLRAVFGLVPPAPTEWVLVLGFPAVILLLDEGRKLLQRAVARARTVSTGHGASATTR